MKTPDLALSALFSRGDLPQRIRVAQAFSPVSRIRVGHEFEWRDHSPGFGSYEPVNGCEFCLLAHEVRRHLNKIYVAAVPAEVAA